MKAIDRKPRPLRRDAASLRDDRLFIVACDDTYAPSQYFNFFSIARIKIHVVATQDGTSSAPHVLERLLQFSHDPDDELWMLLDTDHCTQKNHLPTFIKAITEAKKRNIKVALSKPCFEIWLLLHHLDERHISALENAYAAELLLRKTLGSYNKSRLQREHFHQETVRNAFLRAKRLAGIVQGGHVPDKNMSDVYLLWQAIAQKSLPSQLPQGLRDIMEKFRES